MRIHLEWIETITKCSGKKSEFVDAEFVATCDELVTKEFETYNKLGAPRRI